MPVNIEIKARTRNFADLRLRAETLSDTPAQVIPQEDTFFHTTKGRLKLRQLAPERGQLVYYERTDASGPKRSEYILAETLEPSALKDVLTAALGVRGVIRKRRTLYLVGQTRLHLDEVEGLGEFMELEVMLRPEQSEAEGQAVAQDLMTRLGVLKEDLLEGAYMDLNGRKMTTACALVLSPGHVFPGHDEAPSRFQYLGGWDSKPYAGSVRFLDPQPALRNL